jgi:hypothetical protein
MKKKPIDMPKFVNEGEEADWWASRQGRDATVRSGPVTLHAVQGPDRTWQVDSGSWCS